MTLTEFLLARIAEDEVAVRALKERVAADPGSFISLGLDHPELATGDSPSYLGEYDPARVLAECAAKRAIIEAHPLTTEVVPVWTGSTPGYACDNCARLSKADPKSIVEDIGPCDTLAALASIYANHPDYDETWRP